MNSIWKWDQSVILLKQLHLESNVISPLFCYIYMSCESATSFLKLNFTGKSYRLTPVYLLLFSWNPLIRSVSGKMCCFWWNNYLFTSHEFILHYSHEFIECFKMFLMLSPCFPGVMAAFWIPNETLYKRRGNFTAVPDPELIQQTEWWKLIEVADWLEFTILWFKPEDSLRKQKCGALWRRQLAGVRCGDIYVLS